VDVIQPLVDTVGLDQRVPITVLGGSPAGSIQSGDVQISSNAEHTINVGDQTIFFVSKRAMAWRGGTVANQATRPIIRLMGIPTFSYLTQKKDGFYHSVDTSEPPISLDALHQKIAKIRVR
jgi:hypothetical protein